MMSEEIPGKIGKYDDNYIVEMSNSAEPFEIKHYRLITQEQYEAELKEAYFSGWEDRNDNELTEIFHKRSRTKEEYFKWFMEEKKNADSKVVFDDDDGNQD
jgi:hypothetical protein